MSERVIADFMGKVRTPGMADFVQGRVILGSTQLLCVVSDDRRRIPLNRIHGLTIFDADNGIDQFFDSALTIQERHGQSSGRTLIQAKPETLRRFRDMLVKIIFRGERLRFWHPATIGGRVRNPTERTATASFGDDRFTFVRDESAVGAIDHTAIVSITPGTTIPKRIEGPTLSIVHHRDGRIVTTVVGTEEKRLCSVLKSYLESQTTRDLGAVRELDLSDVHRRVLVWLYTGCRATQLSNAIPDNVEVQPVLEDLIEADLLTKQDGAFVLTKRGLAAATQTYATAGVKLVS